MAVIVSGPGRMQEAEAVALNECDKAPKDFSRRSRFRNCARDLQSNAMVLSGRRHSRRAMTLHKLFGDLIDSLPPMRLSSIREQERQSHH